MKSSAAPSPPKLVNRGGRRPQPVVIRNRGQEHLTQLSGTLTEVAAAIGVSRQAVQQWRSGAETPGPAMRGKLFDAFGIPAAAWGLQPSNAPVAPAEPPPLPVVTPTTLSDCLALHATIRQARNAADLTTAERVRLSDTEARVLALRHRFEREHEREHELSEDRIVRQHPKWQALKRSLTKVVAGCPRCSKLLLDELARLDM
jgi:transcriptional regulator with XRE-family HTH domain